MGSDMQVEKSENTFSFDNKQLEFEGMMVANERYRQIAYDNMCVLYTQLALELINEKPDSSKKFAKQSLDFYNMRIPYFEGKDKTILENLKATILSIINDESTPEDIQRGLLEVKVIDEKLKSGFDQALAEYYKILT
jgi:hypothetical protein